MACGWTIGDAAWASVNWDLRKMAAAIANERAARNIGLTRFSETEVAQCKEQIQREKPTAPR